MNYKAILITLLLLVSACKTADDTTAANTSQSAKRYPLKGTVVSIDKQNKTAKVDHENIPGFMEAMTMDFPIRENWVWDDLTPGAIIQAELVVDSSAKDPYWLEKIGISAIPRPGQQPPPAGETAPQIGRAVPPVRLTDQDGKKFSLTDYKGKALAVTFIYRECPLPEYCIKMSQLFSDAAARISTDTELREKARLVSVSFDPARDTPEKLRKYGLGYMGNPAKPDFSIWRLAVGSDKEVRAVADFFGLKYEVDENDKTQINHSLVTAVVGPDGNVKKIFAGNRWTTDELLKSMQEAAG